MNFNKLMREAYREALRSPDPSTQNGAVLVPRSPRPEAAELAFGHNRVQFGWGFDYNEEESREDKYLLTTHAEEDAILNAARAGFQTDGAVLVCPWAPCRRCAIAIVSAGVSTLVVHKRRMRLESCWDGQISESIDFLIKNGVGFLELDADLNCDPIRVSGKEWRP